MENSDSNRLKPWFALTGEERSYIIYQAYQRRFLKSDDIKHYLIKSRTNNISNVVFPLIFLPIFKYNKNWSLSILRRNPPGALLACQLSIIGLSWLAWINLSPFYNSLVEEREKTLDLLERRLGMKMKLFNDMIPRYWGETEINRKLKKLFNQRNGVLAGYLHPYEESAEPLLDRENWPKYQKKGKITK